MPTRLVRMIAKHEEERKAARDSRSTSSLDARIEAMIEKFDPRKDESLLEPVEGVPALTQWEIQLSNALSLILLDEIAGHALLELKDIDRQAEAELRIQDEIGPEAVRRIPPILVGNIEKTLRNLEEGSRGS